MPKKSWIDKAAETGDWSQAEQKAAKALRKSSAEILQAADDTDADGADAEEAEAEVLGSKKVAQITPISELVRRKPRPPPKPWAEQRAEYERETARIQKINAQLNALFTALAAGDYDRARAWAGKMISEEEEQRRWAMHDSWQQRRPNWAGVSNFRLPGPPPDPPSLRLPEKTKLQYRFLTILSTEIGGENPNSIVRKPILLVIVRNPLLPLYSWVLLRQNTTIAPHQLVSPVTPCRVTRGPSKNILGGFRWNCG
jgi:hypothetical protein